MKAIISRHWQMWQRPPKDKEEDNQQRLTVDF